VHENETSRSDCRAGQERPTPPGGRRDEPERRRPKSECHIDERARRPHDRAAHVRWDAVDETVDRYAQDRAGNFWYLGEDTQSYEKGKPTHTEGWAAGVAGALPGIFMLADPKVGDAYRQNSGRGTWGISRRCCASVPPGPQALATIATSSSSEP